MTDLFINLLNMSITASWLALAVFALRLLLKKAPKAISVLLWGLVGIRLICPFSFESVLSLIPSTETVPESIVYSQSPAIESGIPAVNSAVNPIISDTFAPTLSDSVNPLQVVTYIASFVWAIGMIAMLLYTAVSYLRIHRRVREAVPLKDNIMLCDRIDTPFILGVIRPRIFLPSSMDSEDSGYVIAHEKAHLKRRDHWWKPLGFLLLTVYWFNPVLWLAYILLCRDIELACDEKVIKEMGAQIKKPYSNALVNCSVPRRAVAACPLAFGETGVKSRIKSVLSYKRPAFWIVAVAVIASVAVAVCFMTNPKTPLSKSNPDLDSAVSQAIFDINSQYSHIGECVAEGHVVLGTEEKGDTCKVYLIEGFASFGFENGYFMEQSGHIIPAVMTFRHDESGYTLTDWEYAKDGADHVKSIKKMFPSELVHRAVSMTDKDRQSLWAQQVAYAEKYLEKLGREAEICDYGDVEHVFLTDMGVSVEVSNKLSGFKDTEIGFYEVIEDGERYVYRTAYLADKNVILYTKEIYGTNQIVERTEIDSLTGNVISVNDSSAYFDAKVIEVRESSVLVEPFENTPERKSADRIYVSTKVRSSVEPPALYDGALIRIFYDGLIGETYPAQINGVEAIYLYADVNMLGNQSPKNESANGSQTEKKQPTTRAYYITE